MPAATDLDAELGRIAAMTIDELRDFWRETRGREPPEALTKDLIARALAHFLQEERFGWLKPQLRKLLASFSGKGKLPMRHLKVGSIIVREYQGKVHEVMIVPDGFCWQGKVYASLSTIARKITGTSWNGPRFFGLRGGEPAPSLTAAQEPTAPRRKPRADAKPIQPVSSAAAKHLVARASRATSSSVSVSQSRESSEHPGVRL